MIAVLDLLMFSAKNGLGIIIGYQVLYHQKVLCDTIIMYSTVWRLPFEDIKNFKDFIDFYRTSEIFTIKLIRLSILPLSTHSSLKVYLQNSYPI